MSDNKVVRFTMARYLINLLFITIKVFRGEMNLYSPLQIPEWRRLWDFRRAAGSVTFYISPILSFRRMWLTSLCSLTVCPPGSAIGSLPSLALTCVCVSARGAVSGGKRDAACGPSASPHAADGSQRLTASASPPNRTAGTAVQPPSIDRRPVW